MMEFLLVLKFLSVGEQKLAAKINFPENSAHGNFGFFYRNDNHFDFLVEIRMKIFTYDTIRSAYDGVNRHHRRRREKF